MLTLIEVLNDDRHQLAFDHSKNNKIIHNAEYTLNGDRCKIFLCILMSLVNINHLKNSKIHMTRKYCTCTFNSWMAIQISNLI